MTEREIQERFDEAEAVGVAGDARAAIHMYQKLGDELKEIRGQFHSDVLDAYEAMSRWVSGG